MEKLYFVKPTIKYKEQGIQYIEEHIEYGSHINGSGGLDRFVGDYEGWLDKISYEATMEPTEKLVPAETYYLVRDIDDKIIGMINIRLCLNDNLEKRGGHIGYGIRPTERRKGYNKINLYLGLLVCQEHGIKIAKLDCDEDNLGSKKTMEALGGIQTKRYYDDGHKCYVLRYEFDVDKSIKEYSKTYEPLIRR